jgi:hypothetical protein
MPKSDKDTTKKGNYRHAKILKKKKILANRIQQHILKKSHTIIKLVSFQGCKDGSTYVS